MTTREEQKLFAELAKRGVHVSHDLLKSEADGVQGPRLPDATDPKTSSVSPSSPKPMVPTHDVLDSATTRGRGNAQPPGVGDNIPPRTIGVEISTPVQLGGFQYATKFNQAIAIGDVAATRTCSSGCS